MASKAARIAAIARQIFGTVPNRGVRTGLQYLKKPLTGAYEARWYMEPIEPIARKVQHAIIMMRCYYVTAVLSCEEILFFGHKYADTFSPRISLGAKGVLSSSIVYIRVTRA